VSPFRLIPFQYTFPPQPLVISACAELVKRVINEEGTQENPSGMLSWIAPLNNKGKGKETEKNKMKSLIVVGYVVCLLFYEGRQLTLIEQNLLNR